MNTARAIALELKDDGDPADAVTKALADLTKTVDDRFKVVETKSVDAAKVTERLDKIEAKLNRPSANDNKDPASDDKKIETKAFGKFLRGGRESLGADEIKSLVVGDDPRGGYLSPPQFVAQMICQLVQFSPVRAAARVGATGNSSVVLPVRTGVTNALWEGETETGPHQPRKKLKI